MSTSQQTRETGPLERTFGRRTGACDNCKGPFLIPNNVKRGTKKKRFCCDNCRKEFWKNKGVSVYKLKEQVRAWVRDEWKAIRNEYETDPTSLTNLLERMVAIESIPMIFRATERLKASNGRASRS